LGETTEATREKMEQLRVKGDESKESAKDRSREEAGRAQESRGGLLNKTEQAWTGLKDSIFGGTKESTEQAQEKTRETFGDDKEKNAENVLRDMQQKTERAEMGTGKAQEHLEESKGILRTITDSVKGVIGGGNNKPSDQQPEQGKL